MIRRGLEDLPGFIVGGRKFNIRYENNTVSMMDPEEKQK